MPIILLLPILLLPILLPPIFLLPILLLSILLLPILLLPILLLSILLLLVCRDLSDKVYFLSPGHAENHNKGGYGYQQKRQNPRQWHGVSSEKKLTRLLQNW
jgi:hypothetical protein